MLYFDIDTPMRACNAAHSKHDVRVLQNENKNRFDYVVFNI